MEEFRGVELAAVPVILRIAWKRGAPSRAGAARTGGAAFWAFFVFFFLLFLFCFFLGAHPGAEEVEEGVAAVPNAELWIPQRAGDQRV